MGAYCELSFDLEIFSFYSNKMSLIHCIENPRRINCFRLWTKLSSVISIEKVSKLKILIGPINRIHKRRFLYLFNKLIKEVVILTKVSSAKAQDMPLVHT